MIPADSAGAAGSAGSAVSSRSTDLPLVVATDLDRTLLRDDRTISQRTRDALVLAAGQGAQIIAVTARPIRWLPELAPEFGLLPHVIASNGAVCFDLAAGTPYDLLPFDPAALPGIVYRLHEALPTARIAMETPGGLFREPDYEVSPFDPDDGDPGRRIGTLPDLLAGLDGSPVLKIVVVDRQRPSEEMAADAGPAVGGDAEVSFSKGTGLLEVGPPGVTKASTLSAWCAARGIGAGRVVAFGDMPNDLPMLRWAGRSYAVANAHPDVLATAGTVTGSNEEDGVAMVLEELFGA